MFTLYDSLEREGAKTRRREENKEWFLSRGCTRMHRNQSAIELRFLFVFIRVHSWITLLFSSLRLCLCAFQTEFQIRAIRRWIRLLGKDENRLGNFASSCSLL